MKLLKFSATWCSPCKALSKTLEGKDLGVPIQPVDIDVEPELTAKYGVRSVPTMVLVDDAGNAVKTLTGSRPLEAIKSWLAN